MNGKEKKKPINYANAFTEARKLIWSHRWRLATGLLLMLVGRALAMVMPASTKWVVDEVIGKGRTDMLWTVAVAAAVVKLAVDE